MAVVAVLAVMTLVAVVTLVVEFLEPSWNVIVRMALSKWLCVDCIAWIVL